MLCAEPAVFLRRLFVADQGVDTYERTETDCSCVFEFTMIHHKDNLFGTADHGSLDFGFMQRVVRGAGLNADAGCAHESRDDAEVVQAVDGRHADKRPCLVVVEATGGYQVHGRVFLDFMIDNQAVADDDQVFAFGDERQQTDGCSTGIDIQRIAIRDKTGGQSADMLLFIDGFCASGRKGHDIVILVPDDTAINLGYAAGPEQHLDIPPDRVQGNLKMPAEVGYRGTFMFL